MTPSEPPRAPSETPAGLAGPVATAAGSAAALAAGWADAAAIAAGALVGVVVSLLSRRAARRARAAGLSALATAIGDVATSRDASPLAAFRAGDLGDVARAVEGEFAEAAAERAGLIRDRGRLTAVLSGMVEGVIVVNGVGDVETVNRAARQMLRLDDDPVGRRYTGLIAHPDVVSQVREALSGIEPVGVELSLAREPQQILVSRAAPIVGGGHRGALIVLHDITDLRHADRIRRDFVANVSHELRTPLTAIRGYVEALADGPDDAESRARFLAIIERHARRMESLIRDLLRIARLDAGREEIDVRTCVVDGVFAGVVSELRPTLDARTQQVAVAIAPDAQRLDADAAKLHDIVRNLAENASNYSPGHSTITLSSSRDGDHVVIAVTDEGPGIPEADLQRIFERFYRVDKARSRETGGTGLGLSIVRHLVDLHGGDVQAANVPGGGARFTVRLPQ